MIVVLKWVVMLAVAFTIGFTIGSVVSITWLALLLSITCAFVWAKIYIRFIGLN